MAIEVERGEFPPPPSVKNQNMGMGYIFTGVFSLWRGVVPSPKIAPNLPRTYNKFYCHQFRLLFPLSFISQFFPPSIGGGDEAKRYNFHLIGYMII